MKLPKLYRVVYLELEWLTDTCEGGEHVQRGGYNYPRARLVLKNGVRAWQVIDKDLIPNDYEQCDFEPADYYEWPWKAVDEDYKKAMEKFKHDPQMSWNRPTIAERKKLKSDIARLDFIF